MFFHRVWQWSAAALCVSWVADRGQKKCWAQECAFCFCALLAACCRCLTLQRPARLKTSKDMAWAWHGHGSIVFLLWPCYCRSESRKQLANSLQTLNLPAILGVSDSYLTTIASFHFSKQGEAILKCKQSWHQSFLQKESIAIPGELMNKSLICLHSLRNKRLHHPYGCTVG